MPDLAVSEQTARAEIRESLLGDTPSLSPKFFYDRAGSILFDRITRLPGYYLTETEVCLLEAHADEIAQGVGPEAVLAEFAAGSARKARIVLDGLERPAAYVPLDISEETLAGQAEEVRRHRPDLRVLPVAADFSQEFTLPDFDFLHRRVVAFYAGSSIGNLEPAEASALLARIGRAVGEDARLLLGADRKKDKATLETAYNDPEGLNAAFNRNILNNVNALADGDFDPEQWTHRADYNEDRGRIELHLVSERDQTVRIAGEVLHFARGATIHTENSYKYSVDEILDIAAPGWTPLQSWTDSRELFSVFLFARSERTPTNASASA